MKTLSLKEGGVPYSVRRCARFFKTILTGIFCWFTGYAPANHYPIITRSRCSHLLSAYVQILLGVTLSSCGLAQGGYGYMLIPIGYMFTVGGGRKLQVQINHHCVHVNFAGTKTIDFLLAEFNSTLLFIQNAVAYEFDHVKLHHKLAYTATLIDPDFVFLYALGFKPGMSKRSLWRHLLLTLISPRFHLLFLRARFQSNFLAKMPAEATGKGEVGIRPWYWKRIIASWVWLALILMILFLTGWWLTFLLAVVLPLTFFYHISSLLQFLSEHLWLLETDTAGGTSGMGIVQIKERYPKLTRARFCGEPLKDLRGLGTSQKAGHIGWWATKHLLFHLPVRICVLCGDLPAHDHHHLKPRNPNWQNFLHSRKSDAATLHLTEVWGLQNAIDQVFEELSKMPPLTSLQDSGNADGYLGM